MSDVTYTAIMATGYSGQLPRRNPIASALELATMIIDSLIYIMTPFLRQCAELRDLPWKNGRETGNRAPGRSNARNSSFARRIIWQAGCGSTLREGLVALRSFHVNWRMIS
jgi:hypothetical protein